MIFIESEQCQYWSHGVIVMVRFVIAKQLRVRTQIAYSHVYSDFPSSCNMYTVHNADINHAPIRFAYVTSAGCARAHAAVTN